MLIYIAFRFEWIYGVAAVLAVFHDTIVTVGLFSILNEEITLTVVAALLTLVGYSMNDTIVIFDRIRENLKLSKRQKFRGVGEREYQPDYEQDGFDLRLDVPYGSFSADIWWAGPARVLPCACDRYYHWYLFVGFHREPDLDLGSRLG